MLSCKDVVPILLQELRTRIQTQFLKAFEEFATTSNNFQVFMRIHKSYLKHAALVFIVWIIHFNSGWKCRQIFINTSITIIIDPILQFFVYPSITIIIHSICWGIYTCTFPCDISEPQPSWITVRIAQA